MLFKVMPADMAELVDALDLGSSIARCEGSSPFVRINFKVCDCMGALAPQSSSQTLYLNGV